VRDRLADLNLKLGREAEDASLDPIPRALGRGDEPWSHYGYDLWNAYEVSFLLPSGKPAVYHMQVSYGADSPNMVESKSFKLFLNAQNDKTFADVGAFEGFVRKALGACVGAPVRCSFLGPELFLADCKLPGRSVDGLEPTRLAEEVDADLLETRDCDGFVQYHSHLLRSNCPVTNQPDWGAVLVRVKGSRAVTGESLLAYLLSYRNHQGFHESCCERIFGDLHAAMQPDLLEVGCFYTRRGGLDINPFRTTERNHDMFLRPVWRQ